MKPTIELALVFLILAAFVNRYGGMIWLVWGWHRRNRRARNSNLNRGDA